jgi:hypothetical protein
MENRFGKTGKKDELGKKKGILISTLESSIINSYMTFQYRFHHNLTNPNCNVDIRSRANTTRGLDYEHVIKARAHKGGVRIGKTPKKLASICCP